MREIKRPALIMPLRHRALGSTKRAVLAGPHRDESYFLCDSWAEFEPAIFGL